MDWSLYNVVPNRVGTALKIHQLPKHSSTTYKRQGGHSSFPVEDPAYPGHYMSYNRMKWSNDTGRIDKDCPSIQESWQLCSFGCKYVVLSKSDKERHDKISHYAERRAAARMQQQQKRRSEATKASHQKKKKK
jgi:hypothetical protein